MYYAVIGLIRWTRDMLLFRLPLKTLNFHKKREIKGGTITKYSKWIQKIVTVLIISKVTHCPFGRSRLDRPADGPRWSLFWSVI